MASITLRQLPTMTSGLPGSLTDEEHGFTASDNWVSTILPDSELTSGSPGFGYSHAGAHPVAAIVQHATGECVLTCARAKLFDPLGIAARGHGEARSAVPHRGMWQAHRVVSTDWVREATSSQVHSEGNPGGAYG